MQAEHTESKDGVVIGSSPLTVEDVATVACRGGKVALSHDATLRRRIDAGVAYLADALKSGQRVYGVTTGFGDSCDNQVAGQQGLALARNLVRFHRCGTGRCFDEEETRAILVTRLASVARGYSAVRIRVLEGLVALINDNLCPVIPSEGSVGASGDLTPLAYVAAALMGEGELMTPPGPRPAGEVLAESASLPLSLGPREALALMNGTSAMTGLAALAVSRAKRLARFSAALTAGAVEVLRGNVRHFDDRIFELKPHPGQWAFARWIRNDLGPVPMSSDSAPKIQDRYSIRCAPHVVGVLVDFMPSLQAFVETELNSVNDNPIVDPDTSGIYHSGNFYGGHVCQVADTLKACVANVADLLDRQLALLCNPVTNNGLPRDLVLAPAGESTAHHGFKAMQIAASALTAEAAKLTMPVSVFSRSTENHNQDKVSMGTIAARDCLRVIELTETVAAIHLLAVCQAIDLRGGAVSGSRAAQLHAKVREGITMNTADRPMDSDIASIVGWLRKDELPIGDARAW